MIDRKQRSILSFPTMKSILTKNLVFYSINGYTFVLKSPIAEQSFDVVEIDSGVETVLRSCVCTLLKMERVSLKFTLHTYH